MQLRTLAAIAGGIALVSQLPAQTTATFMEYGYGCKACIQSNEDAQTNAAKTLRTQTLPNEYSYGYTAPANIMVHGFAMFTQAPTARFTMGTAIYPEDPATAGQPDATAAGTGMMTADTTAGWYVTKFASPVAVASGANFWVSGLDSTNVLASSIAGGTPTTLRIYWRRAGTTWSPTGIVSNPGIVIFCSGTPILQGNNTPKIPSTNFSIDISNAPANSAATLLIGISNTTGPLGPLPNDLAVIGFPGCMLWTSNEFSLSGFTTASGDFSWGIPIPNTPSLDGLNFFTQSYVIDSLTSAISFSNAGEGTAGTL